MASGLDGNSTPFCAVENEGRNLATSGMRFFIPIKITTILEADGVPRLQKSLTGKNLTLLEA